MEKCIIMGNGYEIRSKVKKELMEAFSCEESEVESEIDEYSKVAIISDDIIHEIGGSCSQQNNPGEYGILEDDMVLALRNIVLLNGKKYTINVFEKSYGENNNVKTLEVELSIDNDFTEFDNDFYEIKVKIKNCISNYYKEVYFIEDTQNAKACMELYRMVYLNENKFRSIINKHMVINYGTDWFKKVIDSKYHNSVLHLNSWYLHQPEAEFKNVRCELYNLLIDDLIDMLKDSQIDGISSIERAKYFEFYKSLPTESTLKCVLTPVLINKESVWDKDFSSYIDMEFEGKWAEYKNMRNMVAHNKLICRSVMEKIKQYSSDIFSHLQKIDERLNRVYQDNERAYIHDIYAQINEDRYIEEAGGDPLPNEDDVLIEVNECNDYSIMIVAIENGLNILYDLKETLAWQLEQTITYCGSEENIINNSSVYALYQILDLLNIEEADFHMECIAEITSQNLLNHFISNALVILNKFKDHIEDTDYTMADCFQIGELVEYRDINGRTVLLKSEGSITPYWGSTDYIDLSLYIENTCISSGTIEKQYFDYSIHEDEGYGMPEQEDDLYVNIDDLSDTISNNIDRDISTLNNIKLILETTFSSVIE